MSVVNLRRYSLARGLVKGSEFADIPYVVPIPQPSIDTVDLKIWYDVGNPGCYDGSTTLNNLVTGGTFSTATPTNTGGGTITIDDVERGVDFNQTTNGANLYYAYQNLGTINRNSGITMFGFIRKNSGVTPYNSRWCALDGSGSDTTNLLIDTNVRDGVRSEYHNGSAGYINVWNAKTMSNGVWYFAAFSVNTGASAQITMLQTDDTTATSSTFNNASPGSYTVTSGGFGMVPSGGSIQYNWSIGAHGVYQKSMSVTEMRAIRDTYTNMGFYV